MKEQVLDNLKEFKGGFNQLHGHEYHYKANSKCAGDIVELFCSASGDLMAHVCSECGAMRDE